jgi:hypothetical protein
VPVPDSQFVFQDVDRTTPLNMGQLIVELIDVSEVADTDLTEHCFTDLAETNKAQYSEMMFQGPLKIHPQFENDFKDIYAAKVIGI